ncbi:Ig-like domain-containing protein [Muriicola sp.]|uniref:Ig-like domain-containing protein n=1 Tax=Muriicola sp. TaxID=2020856 RepID=UPI003C7635D4
MAITKRFIAGLFLLFMALALHQCARRGSPTGGPKDTQAPVLIKAEPENLTINFKSNKIRLYFDEYIKLQDVQNQLIVSPPFLYPPDISPQGGASKYVELTIKDTLRENTTYTLNFGQSIVDNNENNPSSYLTYVFSTGDYIDSLALLGVVKDAFSKETDEFISVMLYEIDTAYTDSIINKKPPNYITNTQDSTTIFRLQNLKAGKYRLIAVKDEGKNNLYDAVTDKIGFVEDTITLPSDSIYLLNLFREVPKYGPSTPKFSAANKIIFGYNGYNEQLQINPITPIPDSIRTYVAKEPGKDTLNYWFTPFEVDSLIFEVLNERIQKRDTFTVKTRKLPSDSLVLSPKYRGTIGFLDTMAIGANIPILQIDTSRASLTNKDTIPQALKIQLDTLGNSMVFDFDKEPNETYSLSILPGALTELFGATNDTLLYKLKTGSYADYGNLRIRLEGAVTYPIILQLIEPKGKMVRSIISEEDMLYEFNLLEPKKYLLRVIFDANANQRWDTGNFLEKIQPEKIVYFPSEIEVRANWELEQVFPIEE